MAHDLSALSIAGLGALLQRREVSSVEVTRAYLDRIRRFDPHLNAFITLTDRTALLEAQAADEAIASGGYRGAMHGIPVALKDLIHVQGVRTTAGSKILSAHVAEADAVVVTRLRAAGTVLLGKLNLHEWAYGVTSNSPHFGPVRNPWDRERISGGSSGGSAAAVSADLCAGALGTDTGGSIRIPAALCGVVGLKPTYGLVSRSGVLPLSWSLDHVGPITKTVEDAAILLSALAGYVPDDPASADRPAPDYRAALTGDLRSLRIGIPREYFFDELDGEVREAVETAIATLAGMGLAIEEVRIPSAQLSPAISAAILGAEAATVHGDAIRTRGEDFGADVRLRLETGMFVLATDYLIAQQARTVLRHEFREVFERVDALVLPAVPITAPRISENSVIVQGRERDTREALTPFMSSFNQAGLPVISVPCGFSGAGLPIGLQIAGRPFDEATVLRIAHAYESSTRWGARRPSDEDRGLRTED